IRSSPRRWPVAQYPAWARGSETHRCSRAPWSVPMRIATWNVNSLKARLDKLAWWADRTSPDILLLQTPKCTDADAPPDALARLGYDMSHHGSGGRNGVASVSRSPLSGIETNFGVPLKPKPSEASEEDPLGEPRIIAATTAGLRIVSLYAPNGRALG